MVSAALFYSVSAVAFVLLLIAIALAVQNQRLDSTPEQSVTADQFETLRVRVNSIETDQADLREYVTRGVKKMSQRHRKAELLAEVLEESEELDKQQQPDPMGEVVNPNSGRPRLVRNG